MSDYKPPFKSDPPYQTSFKSTPVVANTIDKPFIPTTIAGNVENAQVHPKGVYNEAKAREAIKQKYRGEKFVLIDTNGDGVFDAIDIIPVDWQGLENQKSDAKQHAGYFDHVQSAKNAASAANAGNSADQIAAAVRVAGERAHLSWKGVVPPKTSAEIADDMKVCEAKTVDAAVAVELAKGNKF